MQIFLLHNFNKNQIITYNRCNDFKINLKQIRGWHYINKHICMFVNVHRVCYVHSTQQIDLPSFLYNNFFLNSLNVWMLCYKVIFRKYRNSLLETFISLLIYPFLSSYLVLRIEHLIILVCIHKYRINMFQALDLLKC